MNRSKKLILVSHCLMNANSKVLGCSTYPGVLTPVVRFLCEEGLGLIQLPCPELTLYGLRRWGHVKEQFDTPYYRRHCARLLAPFIDQMEDYLRHGYQIVAVLGVEGSPSCGVEKTCAGDWGGELAGIHEAIRRINTIKMVNERGILMEELLRLLAERQISVPLLGVEETNPKESLEKIKELC